MGHELKDAGYLDLALIYYSQAVRSSLNCQECIEAMVHLGHCAKIAGVYALAVECLAFASYRDEDNSSVESDELGEAKHALTSLTKSFTFG